MGKKLPDFYMIPLKSDFAASEIFCSVAMLNASRENPDARG